MIVAHTLTHQQKHRSNDTQFIQFVVADLSDYKQALNAIHTSTQSGSTPSMIFCCAGCSTPGWFTDMPVENFAKDMNANYFSALHTVKVCVVLSDSLF